MRKGLTTLLVILLAIGAVLVSCKAEVGTPADELVSVSFEEAASRALSATLEEFKVADYFWYYAAKKTDSTGLISGETTSYDAAGAVAISSGDEAKGLSGYTVPGFSQGTWKFTLYAYATRPTTDVEKAAWVYSGEATGVVLQKGGTNKVTVTVSPNPEGYGILFVDMAHIYLSEASKDSDNQVSPVVSVVKHPSGTPVTDTPTGNLEYELPTDTYKVTVSYTDGYITYATGYVIATVYPGLTTTVTGYVDELVTYAEFDAKQNPDIVKETWGSNDITTSTTATVDLRTNKSGDSKTNKVSSATMSADTAVKKLKELADNVGADSYSSSSLKLNLSVDTTDVKETSVTYDIGMEAILTYTKNTTQSTAKSDVKNVDDYVLVDINLTSDITAVSVTHSGENMILTDDMSRAGEDGETDPKYVDVNEGTQADPLWVGFYMLETKSTGKVLHIKTKSFSPFEVTYAMTDYVASMDGKKYTSIAAAVDAIDNNNLHTITLLKDHSGAGIFLGAGSKNIVIDLGGYTFTCTEPVGSTGTENQALHLEKGNTVTIKNGTITSPATTTATFRFIIQNYSNLTLEDVTLDGRYLNSENRRYTLSNNCGEINIQGATNIYASSTNGRAFDVCAYADYTDGVKINVTTTGTISGWVEIDEANKGYPLSLNISNGSFDHNSFIAADNKTTEEEIKSIVTLTGGRYKPNDVAPYAAEGYGVILKEGWLYVVPYDVYNATTKKYYFLAKEGDNKGKLVNGGGAVTTPATTDELVLLDSSLANLVADEIDNFNGNYKWTAIHSNTEPDYGNQYFEGGWGTKIEPYLIGTHDQLVNMDATREDVSDLYFALSADIDAKQYDTSSWAHGFYYKDPTYYHVNLRNKILTIGDKPLFGYVVKLEMCGGCITFNGTGSVVSAACNQGMDEYKVYFHDLVLTGSILGNGETHFGPLVSYAYGINSGDAVFTAENINSDIVITSNNSNADVGGLFGYVQGSCAKVIIRNCTMNGSISAKFVGAFINAQNSAPKAGVTSEGNVFNGELIAAEYCRPFGCGGNITGGTSALIALQSTVTIGEKAKMNAVSESDSLISVNDESLEVILHKAVDTIKTYRVAISFNVDLADGSSGGYPRYITFDTDNQFDETKNTGIFKYSIVQDDSDSSEGKTIVVKNDSIVIWIDEGAYHFYSAGYKLSNKKATINAYGFNKDGVIETYQIIGYSFD